MEILKIKKIITLLQYSKTNKSFDTYENGYHTINILDETIKGQRDCSKRIEQISERFVGKTVVDFGCNVGGMLFELSKYIKSGIGLDYHYKYINAAHVITKTNNYDNLDFFTFDIDKENFEIIKCFTDDKVDICAMLSIAKWVKRWKELVEFCASISDSLLFETNGDQQEKQIEFLKEIYDIEIITDRSRDDLSQHNRKLLWCTKKGDS